MDNLRLDLRVTKLAIGIAVTVFPFALIIAMFSNCDIRRRGDKHACQNGAADRCIAVGQFYEARTDGLLAFLLSYPKTAKDYYLRGCKLGNVTSCARFGHMKIPNSYDSLHDDEGTRDDGIAALTTACNSGITDSCRELADALDPAQAAPVLEKLCKAGDKGSCDKLVTAVAATDPKAGLELAVKQCEAGSDAQCADVGGTLLQGSGDEPTRGVALLAKACDRGAGARCNQLGMAYTDGTLPEDPAHAAELFAKGCEHDDADACFSAAKSAVDSDPAKSVTLFTSNCEKGDLRGCDALGDRWRVGTGVTPRSRDHAYKLYDQSCRGGNDFDCYKRDCMSSPDSASDACGKVYLWQHRFVYKLGGRFDMR